MLDRELLWVPILSFIANVFFFGLLLTLAIVVAFGSLGGVPDDSPIWLVFLFLLYLIGAFTVAVAEAVVAHIVYVRAHGGDATLGDGFRRALMHLPSLLLWAAITSTVGVILNLIAERSRVLGQLVAGLLGAAWGVLTYFVVPAMVIGNQSAFAAIPHSGSVFRRTWGETLVANISYNVIFLLALLGLLFSGAGLVVAAIVLNVVWLVPVITGLYLLAFIFGCLVASIFAGILKTLLYIYAAEGEAPKNFNAELLEQVLRKSTKVPDAVPGVATTV